MKRFILIFALMVFVTTLSAQDKNQIVIDEDSGKPMLVGYTTREALSDSAFAWWYNSGYEFYEVDLESIEPVKNMLDDVSVTIVMGTWCSDSRTEVPHFLKIMDALDFPDQRLDRRAIGHGHVHHGGGGADAA